MYKTLSPVISQKQNQEAQILSSKFEDVRLRKKAYVDFSGALYAVEYLQSQNLRANTQKSVFKSAKLYEDFEITDIYCNSHMLYVLTTYDADFVKVPTIHEEYEILPEFYIVVDVKQGMREAEVKGAIRPLDLKNYTKENNFYKIPLDKLSSMEDILPEIKKYAGIKPSIGRHLECMNLFTDYVDNKLTDDNKKKLINHILTCETCKKRLFETIEFDVNSKKIENHNNVLSKEDLSSKESFAKSLQAGIAENTAQLKGAIDVIYKGKDFSRLKVDAFKYKADLPEKTKKLITITLAIVLVFMVLVIFAFNLPPKKASDLKNKNVQGAYLEDDRGGDFNSDFEIVVPKIKKQSGYTTVSKVAWEVSSKGADENQKKFLQQAGKSIRLNLQNDLLLANEAVINPNVKFDIRFQREGALDEVVVSQSTGSSAVDEIIKQSIESTLYYMRPPKGSFVGKKNGLTLVISF